MFGLSPIHILLLLLVVVLIFGTKKLRNAGEDLGAAIKGFKKGLQGGDDKSDAAQLKADPPQSQQDQSTSSSNKDGNTP